MAGAFAVLRCHLRGGELCAGWVAVHDMVHCLALRMHAAEIDWDAVLAFTTSVPLFSSGAEACAHGLAELAAPGREARRKVAALLRLAGVRIAGRGSDG